MNWAEKLVESLTQPEIPEESITANELAEQTGLSSRQSFSILNKKWKSGEVQKVIVRGTGYYFK